MKAVPIAGFPAMVLGAAEPASIGAATMAPDGTITLRLHAEGRAARSASPYGRSPLTGRWP
jgi:hypothetical protein